MTYTVSEVAKLMNVCPATVRRWIRSGKLKAVLSSKKEGYLIYGSALHNMYKTHLDDVNCNLKDEVSETLAIINFHREMMEHYERHLKRLQSIMETRK